MVAGRPTKLTRELQESICNQIEKGEYPSKAATREGINESTYYAWMKRGQEEDEGKYVEFSKAIKKAEIIAEALHLENIRKAAIGEESGKPIWQASAWYLERRDPDHWGRRERVDLKHSGSLDQEVKVDIFAEIDKLEATLQHKKKHRNQNENE